MSTEADGFAEPDGDITAALGDALAARAETPEPSPLDLWRQAGGGTEHYDRQRYLDLMREHGMILAPGDEGCGEASADLPCGWPHRSEEKS